MLPYRSPSAATVRHNDYELENLISVVERNLESLKSLIYPSLALLKRLPPLELELLSVYDLPERDDDQKKLASGRHRLFNRLKFSYLAIASSALMITAGLART